MRCDDGEHPSAAGPRTGTVMHQAAHPKHQASDLVQRPCWHHVDARSPHWWQHWGSPLTAAACLGFLILIHKAEYVINAKVVGRRTHMGVGELLSVMFVSEAVLGPAGLVAAPLFYAYLKKELVAARLV